MTGEPVFNLHEIFLGEQESLLTKLHTGRKHAGHPGAVGDGTEDGWRSVLDEFLPKRYCVSRGFVVDSKGNRSLQLDVIVHDRQYSPRIWEYGGHPYVPAESVYAVFEVKQDLSLSHVQAAAEKAASVRRLHRTRGTFAWLQGPGSRPPTPILAGLLTPTSDWSPAFGKPFGDARTALDADSHLDLGCVLAEGAWELTDLEDVTSLVTSPAESSLISFLMTLAQRLQGLGTVGGIDYGEYQRAGDISS